jgi:hypothetical protein
MLMPHAWPTPVRTTRLVSERDIREQREKPQQLAALYARCFCVPVMFVNCIGRIAPVAGLLGRVMDPEGSAWKADRESSTPTARSRLHSATKRV